METLILIALALSPVAIVALGCLVDNWTSPALQQIRYPVRRPRSARQV